MARARTSEREGSLLQPATEHVYLNDNKVLQGLTGAQFQFALAVHNGASYADAYRQIRDTTGVPPDRIWSRANDFANRPRVKAKIEELRLKSEQPATLAPSLSREWILNGIMDLAQNADKDSTRLAAFIALGKTAGVDLFREIKLTQKDTRKVEDIERELKQRLEDLANAARIIDVSPRAEVPSPARLQPPPHSGPKTSVDKLAQADRARKKTGARSAR